MPTKRKFLILVSLTTIYLLLARYVFWPAANLVPQLDGLTNFIKISLAKELQVVPRLGPISNNTDAKPDIKLLNPKDIHVFKGEILILVTSHIKLHKRRESIRASWGNQTRFVNYSRKYNNASYKVYFITGFLENDFHEAQIESTIYHDLLITNRTEDYRDLSRRFMLGFLWALEHCTFNYVMKTDDDVFVNVPKLFKLLYTDPFVLEHKDRLYAGKIYPTTGPIRDTKSKWHVTKEEWALDYYPPFATGMCIILSRLILERIRPLFDWINPFRLEDVYIGMLVNRANIAQIGIRVDVYEMDQFYNFHMKGECQYMRQAITYHKVDGPSCMEQLTTLSIHNPRHYFYFVVYVFVFIAYNFTFVYIFRRNLKSR